MGRRSIGKDRKTVDIEPTQVIIFSRSTADREDSYEQSIQSYHHKPLRLGRNKGSCLVLDKEINHSTPPPPPPPPPPCATNWSSSTSNRGLSSSAIPARTSCFHCRHRANPSKEFLVGPLQIERTDENKAFIPTTTSHSNS